MKMQALRIAVSVVVLFTVSAAVAQTSPGDVVVNVPFSFVAANQQMQPGRYIVSPAAYGVLRISNSRDSKNQMFASAYALQHSTPSGPKLVFHRYGDSYFLAEVWNGSGATGKQLPRSKAEKEVASVTVNGARRKAEIAEVRPER